MFGLDIDLMTDTIEMLEMIRIYVRARVRNWVLLKLRDTLISGHPLLD